MVNLDVFVTATIDGASAPGFPYRRRLVCSSVFVLEDSRTSGAYVNILPSFQPTATQKIKFVLVIPRTACNVAINDAVPSDPISLTAGSILMICGTSINHATATPAITIQSLTTTTYTLVVGLE